MIGIKLYRTKSCTDSMAWANQNLSNAPDGSVFIADSLDLAKGRHGRIWTWMPGQLALTIILKPTTYNIGSFEDIPIRLNQLNMAITLGIHCVFSEFGVGIKWPNDFILNDKKLGGILFQVVWQNNFPFGVICGFAININNIFHESCDLFNVATSLKQELNRDFDMRVIYRKLLNTIDKFYQVWLHGQFDYIYKLWRSAQLNLGKQISFHMSNGELICGKMLQVLPNGDVIIVNSAGKQQIISFYSVHNV